MPYKFSMSSIKFQGHTGWKIDDLNPIWVRLLGRPQLSNPSDLPCFYWFCMNAYIFGARVTATAPTFLIAVHVFNIFKTRLTCYIYHFLFEKYYAAVWHFTNSNWDGGLHNTRGPFWNIVCILIPGWISNYIHHKVWMKLLIYAQTSTVQSLKFGNG